MTQKLDEITIAKIKKAYIAGEGTLNDMAERYGVSGRTIKRYSKAGDWDALKKARGAVINEAVRERIRSDGEIDRDKILVDAIDDLVTGMVGVPVRSKEGAAGAIVKLLEAYEKTHPMTIDELIDAAFRIPNFSPQEFAKALRERVQKNA